MLLKVLVFLVLVSVSVKSQQPTFNDDVLGLIFFKAGLEDPNAKLQSWSEDDNDPCNWVGIKCDPTTYRVTELHLDGLSLSGHVGRGLLRLQFLQVLSLSNNNLTGTISAELSRIGTLQVFDLSGNDLSGPIPEEFFSQCGSLKSVSLARNNLSGQIPGSLSSCWGLAEFNFSYNQISGQLPSGIWYLRTLQSIDVSGNLLEGDIPEGIGNLYDLRHLNLGNNRFSGRLPGDIGSCSFLKHVDFGLNYFSGSLPDSMRKLVSCTRIILRRNSLRGQVPGWFGELTSLESLDLSANQFYGRVPYSLGNLQSLKELNLSMNQFTGKVPPWMFRASFDQVLQVLDLSSNGFYGEIPSKLGVLSSLVLFNMSRNRLFGSIPSAIGELKATQVVDLSDNMLNGSIPSEIGAAVSLKVLVLQRNFLSGKIPTQIVNCSSLTTLILSENNLSGSIPTAFPNLSNLEYVDLSLNELTGSLPKELANLSQLVFFNISHNHLHGELPLGGFFNTIPTSSVSGNPSLCGSVVNRSCPAVHPKPIVLNPNSSDSIGGSSRDHPRKKIVLSISALVSIGAAAFIVIGVIAITLLNIHVRSTARAAAALMLSGAEDFSCSPTNDPKYGKLVMFSGDANFVAGANALLNKDCELGHGGFGVVYRTILRDGRAVAIKKLTVSSLIKSQLEFEREVQTLGKIRHHNLVSLEGYYWTPSLQLLIYEFVPSGNLYKHLHDGPDGSYLSWQQRFNIILGMAKGLAYLHQMNIIHYNLKSTNILVDSSSEAKVGDYGLARLLPTLDRCVLSSKIQSALGYMAPEFACKTVKITEKCDVYGFGVLVLEVITGKRPVEYMEDDVVVLSDMVRGALGDGRVEECVDGRLRNNFPTEEAIPVIKLGLICASQVPSNRPDMEEVVNILELIQCPCDGNGKEEVE
ncbi:PXY/TDR-correlated 2 [Hibiscus trionum]|uniref:PXY/TDR-correlated 2 n=1 Tax=Hibiscus trionum TaxID=183268 RepID=A0A9W7M4V7_HIBTR|nr:PXY/TDR-correlated 2 [Hibiscus trionum]